MKYWTRESLPHGVHAETGYAGDGAAAVDYETDGHGGHRTVENGDMLVSYRCSGVNCLPLAVRHPGLHAERPDAFTLSDIFLDDTAVY